jgi:hypothetical protein
MLWIIGPDGKIFKSLKEICHDGVTIWIAFNWPSRKSGDGLLSTRKGKNFLGQLSDC